MKAFVGLVILIATMHSHISTSGISSVLSLVRYEQLFRCLHFNANAKHIPFGSSDHDRLFKVRKLLDLVVPLLKSKYNR